MKKALVSIIVLVGAVFSGIMAHYYLYVLPIRRGLSMLYPGLAFSPNSVRPSIYKRGHRYIKVERD